MATHSSTPGSTFRRNIPALVLAMLIFAAFTFAWLIYGWSLASMKEAAFRDLEAIARLKSVQVDQLRHERLADADVLTSTPLLHEAIIDIAAGQREARNVLERHLATVQRAYGYRQAFVQSFDPPVRIPETEVSSAVEVTETIDRASRADSAVMSNIYSAADNGEQTIISVAAPIHDGSSSAIGVAVLSLDANDLLFPVLESDHLPQSRAITVIRSRGREAWLSSMGAMGFVSLHESLDGPDEAPFIEAIRKGGAYEGPAPNGQEVLAFLHPAGNEWQIMASVRVGEIAAAARQQSAFVLVSMLLIILVVALLVSGLRRRLGTMEAEHRRQQELLEVAGDVAKFGGWSMSLDDQRVDWTPELHDIFETTTRQKGTLQYDDILEFFEPEQRELLSAKVEQCVSAGEPYDLRLPMISAAGNRKWIRAIGQPTRDPDGNIVGIHGACQDITEQRTAAVELGAANDMLSRTMDSLSEAVFVVQPDGREILRCNRAVEGMLGYGRAELIGQSTGMLYESEEAWQEFGARSERALKEFGIYQGEFRMRHKDGHLITTEHTVTPLRGDEWQDGVVSVVRDISHEKSAEIRQKQLSAQLNQAQKMEAIGRLAGGLAHDYNNMLGVIRGYTELAMEHLKANDPARGELDEVLSAAHRSAQLTRQLLGFARQQAVSPRVLDLNDTVETMSRMLSRLIGEHIELAWRPGKDLWPVNVDPSQLDQVLANLVVNARDALKDHGTVMLATANVHLGNDEVPDLRAGDYVCISVIDSGHGIAEDIIDHIFEPFFTTKEQGTGTGLGLATVHGIVSQNHGAITASNEPGHGARFDVYLPRAPGKAETIAAPAGAASMPGGKETILLVEDEEALLKLSERILKRLGYNVIATAQPDRAIEIAEDSSRRIDLLVTDLVMPRVHGRELAERIRGGRPDLRVLMMSGYSSDATDGDHLLANGDVFIEKPFSSATLAEKVRVAMGNQKDREK